MDMTQLYESSGAVVPVTVVAAGPCTVTRIIDAPKGRRAQIGFEPKKPRAKGTKRSPQQYRVLKEFPLAPKAELSVGKTVTVAAFAPGDRIRVTGLSKGKGFAGVVKRHHFAGHFTTHGTKDQVRMPGSIGAVYPTHVLKGKRMAGRMGHAQTTVKHLRVMAVDAQKNLLAISGALPGARGNILFLQAES